MKHFSLLSGFPEFFQALMYGTGGLFKLVN